MANDVEKYGWKIDSQDCSKKSSPKCDRNAQSFGILHSYLTDGVVFNIILGQFLRPKILKDTRGEGNQLFDTSPQLHDHVAGLGVKGIPSHVVVAKELNVVEAGQTNRVFGAFVDVDVFANA